MKKLLNPWYDKNRRGSIEYYTLYDMAENPIASCGDFSVYKMFSKSYLYTYRDKVIGNIAGFNIELLARLITKQAPSDRGMLFLYDRMASRL